MIQVTADQLDPTLARYQADPQVQSAEANKLRLSESIPSDPFYMNQWALPRIGWDQVFGVITPTGPAKVALLDTGVDTSHPELTGKLVPGTSIVDGSNGMTDPSGHGTWLAGIIAAQTDTTEGIAGVAYAGVQIMPVTVLNANGEGMDSDVIAGVIWAADHGADVILMAFSNPGFSPNLQDAIDYAWSRGVVLVAAAGNDASSDPHFPAGDRGVMGVAATDPSDALASFSNDGLAVFIAAPGVDIQTVDIGSAYTMISGTSASAAIVAGSAALMKAVDPTLTNGIIVGRLARNADPAGTQAQTGNGRVNLARALADTSTEPIQPAGADPVGQGGPFVGPYQAAARSIRITFAGTGSGQVQIRPTSGSVSFATTGSNRCDTPPASGIGNNTPAVTINGTCTTLSSSDNNTTVTVTAAPGGTSFFAAWSNASGSFTSCNLNNATCSQVLGGGQNDLTVTFTARASTTTAASKATATFGAPSVTLNATVAPSTVNEGTVTFTVKKGATTIGSPVTSGTLAGGNASAIFPLSGVDADTYVIEAVYNPAAANPRFFTSSDNMATLTVNPAPVTVSITGGPFTYDASSHAATVTLNPSIAGYSVNYAGTATVYTSSAPPTNADTYTVTVTITDPNYILAASEIGSITINKKPASVTPNVASKTYGDGDPALTGTLSGFLAADGVTATYSRTAGETVAGGPYTISATLSPAAVLGNYTITSNTAKFTINGRQASVTPNVASKTYGDADPVLTGTLSGFLAADAVTATYSRTGGETVGGSPYTINAALSPAAVLGNYTITSNTAKFTINGRQASVTPNVASKTYGDADP
ncbi:MAG TPA: S8 family serine peptidase, partial [Methylomirabilota bacterium]|nr:S8 family serine peptidase [Methylomirabilota bacterium]